MCIRDRIVYFLPRDGKFNYQFDINKPWNGQTEDYFDTMVTWIKRADGTWTFDYTIFDR